MQPCVVRTLLSFQTARPFAFFVVSLALLNSYLSYALARTQSGQTMKLSAFYEFPCVRTYRHACIFANCIADITKLLQIKDTFFFPLLGYNSCSIVICISCLLQKWTLNSRCVIQLWHLACYDAMRRRRIMTFVFETVMHTSAFTVNTIARDITARKINDFSIVKGSWSSSRWLIYVNATCVKVYIYNLYIYIYNARDKSLFAKNNS